MADFITCNTVTLAGHHYLLLWICCYESSTWPYGASAPRWMLISRWWLGHFWCCLSNIWCDFLSTFRQQNTVNISISMPGNFIASMSAFITKSTVSENNFMMCHRSAFKCDSFNVNNQCICHITGLDIQNDSLVALCLAWSCLLFRGLALCLLVNAMPSRNSWISWWIVSSCSCKDMNKTQFKHVPPSWLHTINLLIHGFFCYCVKEAMCISWNHSPQAYCGYTVNLFLKQKISCCD